MIYATTLMISIAVTGASITLVTVQRADRRLHRNLADLQQAQLLMYSALEWALVYVEAEPNWRSIMNGAGPASLSLSGLGTIGVEFTDGDGNLADDDTDTVTIEVSTTVDQLTHRTEIAAQSDPHPSLKYAINATNSITLKTVTIGGPIYAITEIDDAPGPVTTADDASFAGPAGVNISGSLVPQDTNAESLTAPAPDISYYTSRATVIVASPDHGDLLLLEQNFTTTTNTQGAPNADGIYLINAGSQDLDIQQIHLKGTLIVQGNGGNRIRVNDPAWFEPGRPDYPTLIIDIHNANVVFRMPAEDLDEDDADVDFNEDGDQDDLFNSSISGLVWVGSGSATLKSSAWTFTGCLVAPSVTVNDGVIVDDDPALAVRRMPGFTDGKLHVIAGSAREIVP